MRGRTSRRLNTSLALLVGGAMVGAVGCGNDSKPEQPRIAVTVFAVGRAQESNSSAYTASFQPYREVAVAFQVSGYVDSITQVPGADGRARDLQGGDPVKEHELLAAVKSGHLSGSGQSGRVRVGRSAGGLCQGQARLRS